MIIGHLDKKFPLLTATFVYREIQALQAKGINIHTFSIWKPKSYELSNEAKHFLDRTFYVFPINWTKFFSIHISYFIKHPRTYLNVLWEYGFKNQKRIKNAIRTFFHFCEAVYLAKEIENKNINHLHSHFANNSTTIAMMVSKLIGISFSFTAHAHDIFADQILLQKKIISAKFIITISNFNKKFLINILPQNNISSKIHIVRCGIDTYKFSRSKVPNVNKKPIILSIGRLVEKKGYPYLIKACKILVDKSIDFRCIIIGDGPQKAYLNNLIGENGLANFVTLAGIIFQEDIINYLNKSEIFVLPCIQAADNDMDGIPVVLMEAMAMQIPVISTQISGIPELIKNMETGLLVPPKNEMALAKGMKLLKDDIELRKKLGAAGKKWVFEKYEITKNTDKLYNIYKKNFRIKNNLNKTK
jgi:glycosyltransferase involved in cell wall biosynthesis